METTINKPIKATPTTIHNKSNIQGQGLSLAERRAYAMRHSPRCSATLCNGVGCKKACLRLSPKSNKHIKLNEILYTKHCRNHGGKQERDAYFRRAMKDKTKPLTKSTEHDIISILTNKPNIIPTHTTPEQNPQVGDGVRDTIVTSNVPSTDIIPVIQTKPISNVTPNGGEGSNAIGDPKNIQKNNLYKIKDVTTRKYFEEAKAGNHTLNEELAVMRALIQRLINRIDVQALDSGDLKLLKGLIHEAANLVKAIDSIDKGRKVQYTRTSIKMTLMKVIDIFKKYIREGTEKEFAEELAKVVNPLTADSGDIVVMKEEIKRG